MTFSRLLARFFARFLVALPVLMAWQAATAQDPGLLRRLAVGPLLATVTPAPSASASASTLERNDADAQAHLAQALAATGAFSLQLRTDIETPPPASGLATFREALAGSDALLIGTVDVKPAGPGTIVSARLSLRAIDPYTAQPLFILGATREGASRDQALGLAAQEVARGLLARLSEMPWQAYLLAADGAQVRLSAGEAQGLRAGLALDVQTQGDRVRSRRTGLLIALPGRSVARLRVEGDGVARRVAGSWAGLDLRDLVVRLLPPAGPAP